LKYEHLVCDNIHLISVEPESIFKSEKYRDLEIDIEDRFKEQFPNEEIVFLSESSLNQIKNPEILIVPVELDKFSFFDLNYEIEFNDLCSLDSMDRKVAILSPREIVNFDLSGLFEDNYSADNTSFALAA